MTAGEVVDTVLERVRDPNAVITSRDFVRDRISDAQRLLNARFGWVLDIATLTTEPERCFYPIAALLPAATQVRFVRDGQRDLVYVPWKTFWFMGRGWPRRLATQSEVYSTIGRDTVVVWPATRTSVALEVRAAKLTTQLVNDASEFEVRDEMVPMISDLATALVLLKARDYAPIDEVMNSLKGRLKERALEPA